MEFNNSNINSNNNNNNNNNYSNRYNNNKMLNYNNLRFQSMLKANLLAAHNTQVYFLKNSSCNLKAVAPQTN